MSDLQANHVFDEHLSCTQPVFSLCLSRYSALCCTYGFEPVKYLVINRSIREISSLSQAGRHFLTRIVADVVKRWLWRRSNRNVHDAICVVDRKGTATQILPPFPFCFVTIPAPLENMPIFCLLSSPLSQVHEFVSYPLP